MESALTGTGMESASPLGLCGLVKFGNPIDRPVYFLPDAIDFVCVASGIDVHGPFHARSQALSHLIFPKGVCPMLFLFEDIGKIKTTHGIISVFFESIE